MAQAMEAPAKLVVGSRHSELAMHQTTYVVSKLKAVFPDMEVEIRSQATEGDQKLDQHLAELARQNAGLFTKDLEANLLAKTCDIVVHSLKDMPTALPDGLCLAAVTQREDPTDAFVVAQRHIGKVRRIAELPDGAVVGTSSVRRAAQLLHRFPRLRIETVRGNLNTRLRKLDAMEEPKYDALVLATAGLNRMGWSHRITTRMDATFYPYGVAQGALGIECRAADETTRACVRYALEHAPTAAVCAAERGMLRGLAGGCQVPIGVETSLDAVGAGDAAAWAGVRAAGGEDAAAAAAAAGPVAAVRINIRGQVLSLDGKQVVEASHTGVVPLPTLPRPPTLSAEALLEPAYWSVAGQLGAELARTLQAKGAEPILRAGREVAGAAALSRPITYGSAEAPAVPEE